MVDRQGRDKLAYALRQFMSGRISEQEWEESLPDGTKDKALQEIADTLEFSFENMYQDYRVEDKSDFSYEGRKSLIRCIAFLYSDLDYSEPVTVLGIIRQIAYAEASLLWIALFPIYIVVCMASYACQKWLHFRRRDTDRLWPFRDQSDLEEVARNPRLLSGRRSPAY